MIEKGKGLVLGKLCTIQLIEADLQLIMSIVANIRNKGNIESDDRVSKRKYRSSPENSIEDSTLEKSLVFGNIPVTGKYEIYAMPDLQACYDRKPYKLGSIVQESTRVETKMIQLMTKILTIMEHYMRTAFRVSKEC